jgi:predicted GH43/DUF377 family glycosyl hydrolase
MFVKRIPLRLDPDPARVILLYLDLHNENRVKSLLNKINSLSENEVTSILKEVTDEFENHYPDLKKSLDKPAESQSYFKKALIENFARIRSYIDSEKIISNDRQLLIGAYVTKEYSLESAALFNPSMIPHPDQTKLSPGELRFILSLRATGEGHISSIEFRTGTVSAKNDIHLDENSSYAVTPNKKNIIFSKKFLEDRIKHIPEFNPEVLKPLPMHFEAKELQIFIEKMDADAFESAVLTDLLDANYNIEFVHQGPLSERVIYPGAKCEAMGMEDVRFVKYIDQGKSCYYGTYTAYDGTSIKSRIIETTDFVNFKIRSLYGQAVNDKGMALFPRKINGKYAMISRQGGEDISIMFSDSIYFWNQSEKLKVPLKHWKFTQIGNCGSPIETEYGWLLLTHAVGPLRKYVMSACLLDLEDPTKVLGSLNEPLMIPEDEEKVGYVPNVLYSCGALIHNQELVLPYAMSDIATGFATVPVDLLLEKLLNHADK